MSRSDMASLPLEISDPNTVGSEKPRSDVTFMNSGAFVPRSLKKFGNLLWLLFKKAAYIIFIVVVVGLILMGLDKLAEFALKNVPCGDLSDGLYDGATGFHTARLAL